MARTADDRAALGRHVRHGGRRRSRRRHPETRRPRPEPLGHDAPASDRASGAGGTDLSGMYVDAQHLVPQVRKRGSHMARTKTKPNPYQTHIDALQRKQNELLDSYQRDKAAGNAQPDDGIQDLADKAASAYSKELNFSLSDGERNLLMLIEEAFARVKDDTYGTCTNCGNVIGDKRLLAVPWTPFCIDCQELQEKGLLG